MSCSANQIKLNLFVLSATDAFFDDSIGAPSLLADQDTFMKTNGLPFWGFPRFGCFYNTIAAAATASGNVTFLTSHPAAAVEVYDSRQNLRSQHRNNHNPTHQDSNSSSTTTSSNSSPRVVVTDQEGAQHVYDAIAMACHAPTALRLLSKPSKLHEAALGGVEYYKQSTILPTDEAYIRRCGLCGLRLNLTVPHEHICVLLRAIRKGGAVC